MGHTYPISIKFKYLPLNVVTHYFLPAWYGSVIYNNTLTQYFLIQVLVFMFIKCRKPFLLTSVPRLKSKENVGGGGGGVVKRGECWGGGRNTIFDSNSF